MATRDNSLKARGGRTDLDDGTAFLPDPRNERPDARDTLADMVGEDFVASATAGEERFEDDRNEFTVEELGGPFVETDEERELAGEPDASNPEDAEVEPFPTAVRSRT